MKRRELLMGAGAAPFALTEAVAARTAAGSRARLDRLLARYTAAWKASDGAALAALYAPEVHWVNIVGMHWQGKADVDYAHRTFFSGPFRGLVETLEEVESLVMLPGGPAVAVVRWAMPAYVSPSGRDMARSRSRMTLVVVPHGDEFLIAHGANITIAEAAQASDPVRRRNAMPSG